MGDCTDEESDPFRIKIFCKRMNPKLPKVLLDKTHFQVPKGTDEVLTMLIIAYSELCRNFQVH